MLPSQGGGAPALPNFGVLYLCRHPLMQNDMFGKVTDGEGRVSWGQLHLPSQGTEPQHSPIFGVLLNAYTFNSEQSNTYITYRSIFALTLN